MRWSVILCILLFAAGLIPAFGAAEGEALLLRVLDDMEKNQNDDFFAAASQVLENTGDELAFVRGVDLQARQGHPVAMFARAKELQRFPGVAGDDLEARDAEVEKLFYAAAQQGYAPAMVEYALSLPLKGEGEEAKATRKDRLMQACKQGSLAARAYYPFISGLVTGSSVDVEQPEVASELKRQNYYMEEILATRLANTREWLERACEHGSAKAAYQLACATEGEEHRAYLHLAAERHWPAAMEDLGIALCRTSDKQGMGLDMLRRVTAMGGSPRGAALVAAAYAGGVLTLDADVPARCARLFLFAHEHGDAVGTVGYAFGLITGAGVEQDVQGGLSLLLSFPQKAPSPENALAALALYTIYAEGLGVEKDAGKAAGYLEQFHRATEGVPSDILPFIDLRAEAPFLPAFR